MFANPQISDETLPKVADVTWQALHRAYVQQQRLVRALIVMGAAAAWFVFRPLGALPPVALAALAVVAVLAATAFLIWPSIDFTHRGYALREHDMVYRRGVLMRSVTAVPFNRIQHVEVSSSPLDRRFGLGSLKLFTAGGSGGDLAIDGLPLDKAERLREHILGKVGSTVERD